MVDVLPDHDREELPDQDVTSSLEQSLVIPPRVFFGEQLRDSVVLPEKQDVEHRITYLRVRPITAHREKPVPLRNGELIEIHDRESLKLWLDDAVLAQVEGELLIVDDLALQSATRVAADQLGDIGVRPVELAQVDVVVRGVLPRILWNAAVTAQEAVGEPLCEVGEENR